MDTPKKVLIFHATAGHGHEKAAKAVLESVSEEFPGVDAREIDAISLMPGIFGHIYRQTYLLQIKYVPWLWGVFYYSFDVPFIYFFMRFIRRVMNSGNSSRMVKLIQSEKPDVIFTTHFFAAEVVSYLKRKGKTAAKLIVIVTDYLPHYVWTGSHVDLYAVGLPETKDGLLKRGVTADKIRITGIPVEKKFFAPVDKREILKKLNLVHDLFTVLITSGGVGVGSAESLIKKILSGGKPSQLILVCGSNRALHDQMLPLQNTFPSLRVLGFVNNMNELMEVCDVVVGKAGGLTITESFLKNKPVIMLGAIPGQEARNVLCVKAHQAGLEARDARDAAQIIVSLRDSSTRMEELRKGIATIAKPDASRQIALLAAAP